MTYTYRLTEEIARWAFEIKCAEAKDWHIVFTNPTAGPWKSMKCINNENIEGEIYRFGAKEDRPDIVLVNDKLQAVIIIEAKDSLHKLIEGNQANKSVKVTDDISKLLKKCNSPFWGDKRRNYSVFLGLLWGCEGSDSKEDINKVVSTYYKLMNTCKNIDKSKIINIVTQKQNEKLTCFLYIKNYEKNNNKNFEKYAAESLNIKILE